MILLFIQLEKITTLNKYFFISPKMVLLQLHGKCCYMSFSCNPDKSDLILKDSTTIPSAEECNIGRYDRQ